MLIKIPVKNGDFILTDPLHIECVLTKPGTGIYRLYHEHSVEYFELSFEQAKELQQIIKSVYHNYCELNSDTDKRNTIQFNPQPDYYKTPSPRGLPYFKILGVDPTEFTDCRSLILMGQQKFDWNFDICSAVKYLWRLGCKGTNLDITKDLLKTKQYLQWALENKTDHHSESLRLRIENCIKEIETNL